MDQSVESVKSQQKLKIRESLPKNSSAMNKKKGSLHRIYT